MTIGRTFEICLRVISPKSLTFEAGKVDQTDHGGSDQEDF